MVPKRLVHVLDRTNQNSIAQWQAIRLIPATITSLTKVQPIVLLEPACGWLYSGIPHWHFLWSIFSSLWG
ncbi:hypothetical protein B9Z19DRAFT_1096924 [Tuber borchii]|uniref:Uncharacterized protein n=1 Tax=Tuber borchii TaxID=42251 RepID=A0A2T6ZAT6_TUBBO|nr:hypothetical protein B9Z19DRAFT_1096924 [Tuber borchii]